MRSGAFSHRYCLQSPRMSQAASIAVPDRNNVRCDWPQDRRPKLVKCTALPHRDDRASPMPRLSARMPEFLANVSASGTELIIHRFDV